MKTAIASIACLCCALASSAAWADSTGQVSHGQLRFTLQDLNLADGIAPALTFQPLPVPGVSPDDDLAHLEASWFLGASSDYVAVPDTGANPFQLSFHASPNAGVTVSLTGRDAPLTQQIDISAHAQFAGSSAAQGSAHGWTPIMWFTLTPQTEVTFSTTVHVDTTITGADGINEWFQEASTLYALVGTWDHGLDFQYDYDMQTAHARAPYEREIHGDFILTATVRNATTSDQPGNVSFMTWATSTSQNVLPEVPEPSSWALTLAGTGLVGLRLRRHRRHPAA